MAHSGELLKWKEACKSYEEKYSCLKEANEEMAAELNKCRVRLAESEESKDRQIE
jgi:hypothetical protein